MDIENKISDSIAPQPDYTLEIQNNDQTIKLTVKSGVQKPCLYKSKAYKRNDTEAEDLGLGSVWVLLFDPEKIRKAFNLPKNIVPHCLLPVGYPSENAVPYRP